LKAISLVGYTSVRYLQKPKPKPIELTKVAIGGRFAIAAAIIIVALCRKLSRFFLHA